MADAVQELLAFGHRLADAAAEVQRHWFRAELTIESKLDESPVTIADRQAELRMRELIEAQYPGHGILGEEYGQQDLGAEFVWVLDPIDGTKSFICGRPQFGTLIGLLHRGQPLLGLIDQSILRERWVGVSGSPAMFNGRTIRTRPCPGLERAVLASYSRRMFAPGPEREAFDALEAKVYLSQFNTDCYGYGLLAAGFVDLVVEQGLQPYDYLPILPILAGAGAIVSDWKGRPVGLGSAGRVIVAGDPRVHAEALAMFEPLSD
ncbi:MAG TPA: inositol monophosphatase family protein [Geminicoccus sp.]|uniref:inositol monophosphatase family protein n=1 Tax=Geminicoccus sp. TaxID=2024832 RepID=UPI002E2EE3F2|nr:inositol monophosphatase family protein [Geminicoccus sp.]HEX2529386.1 inositol monophosphatase family protein [Geminicoccus sp.]